MELSCMDIIATIGTLLLAAMKLVEHNGCLMAQRCCCCVFSVSCQHDLDGSGHFGKQADDEGIGVLPAHHE